MIVTPKLAAGLVVMALVLRQAANLAVSLVTLRTQRLGLADLWTFLLFILLRQTRQLIGGSLVCLFYLLGS